MLFVLQAVASNKKYSRPHRVDIQATTLASNEYLSDVDQSTFVYSAFIELRLIYLSIYFIDSVKRLCVYASICGAVLRPPIDLLAFVTKCTKSSMANDVFTVFVRS